MAAVTGAVVGKPVWVAWTLEDGGATRLRSGETIAEAAAMLDGLPVSAFLVNCCAPESITAAMPELSALGSWPVGAYATRNPVFNITGVGQRVEIVANIRRGHAIFKQPLIRNADKAIGVTTDRPRS